MTAQLTARLARLDPGGGAWAPRERRYAVGILVAGREAGNGYRSLSEGQKVEYEATQGQKGPQATNVRVVG